MVPQAEPSDDSATDESEKEDDILDEEMEDKVSEVNIN